MPPNRKASLDTCDALRFTTVVRYAKDYVPTTSQRISPAESDTYWAWTAAPTENLFSANHMVANMIRDASQQEEELDEVSTSKFSAEYWNPAPQSDVCVLLVWEKPPIEVMIGSGRLFRKNPESHKLLYHLPMSIGKACNLSNEY